MSIWWVCFCWNIQRCVCLNKSFNMKPFETQTWASSQGFGWKRVFLCSRMIRKRQSSRPGQYGLMFTICSDRSRSFSFTHKHTSFFFKRSQSHIELCSQATYKQRRIKKLHCKKCDTILLIWRNIKFLFFFNRCFTYIMNFALHCTVSWVMTHQYIFLFFSLADICLFQKKIWVCLNVQSIL